MSYCARFEPCGALLPGIQELWARRQSSQTELDDEKRASALKNEPKLCWHEGALSTDLCPYRLEMKAGNRSVEAVEVHGFARIPSVPMPRAITSTGIDAAPPRAWSFIGSAQLHVAFTGCFVSPLRAQHVQPAQAAQWSTSPHRRQTGHRSPTPIVTLILLTISRPAAQKVTSSATQRIHYRR